MDRLPPPWRSPMAAMTGAGIAFLPGTVCFLPPTTPTRVLPVGWPGMSLGSDVVLSQRSLFVAPKPDASPIMAAKARATVGIPWMARAETALGARAVVSIDRLAQDPALAAKAVAARRDLLDPAPPPLAPTLPDNLRGGRGASEFDQMP